LSTGIGSDARAALHITADVLNWVYTVPTEKPAPVLARDIKPAARAGGLLGSFWSALTAAPAAPAPAPAPVQAKAPEKDPLASTSARVTLSVWAADVSVRVDAKLGQELLRATKKRPPGATRVELIYVRGPVPALFGMCVLIW
jgi:hypothetical protein